MIGAAFPARHLVILALLAALLALPAAAEEVLFDKDGVVVTREGSCRVLKLRGPGGEVEQSRCEEGRPDHLFHEYSQMQLLGLLYYPEPRQVLIVGLGGASLSRALAGALPEARIDTAEINPAVVEAARRFFYYREGPRVRTLVGDARAYIQGTDAPYDLVFLDAFDGDEIPLPLRTVEFYQTVRRVLRPGGAVVSNFMRRSPLYERDRDTLAAVFPHGTAFHGLGNVVVVSSVEEKQATDEQAQALSRRFGDAYPLEQYFEARELEPWKRADAAPIED